MSSVAAGQYHRKGGVSVERVRSRTGRTGDGGIIFIRIHLPLATSHQPLQMGVFHDRTVADCSGIRIGFVLAVAMMARGLGRGATRRLRAAAAARIARSEGGGSRARRRRAGCRRRRTRSVRRTHRSGASR